MNYIDYFVSFRIKSQYIDEVCVFINDVKINLNKEIYISYDISKIKKCIDKIKEYSITIKNEQLANSNYVFYQYIMFFVTLSKYFSMLQNGQYKESWDTLQDAFDYARNVLKFVDDLDEVSKIVNLLQKYEKLYPYILFSSPEYLITKCRCSICGKSMLGVNCIHRKGQLYWGEIAGEIVEDYTARAIAIVRNPEDKRCILELSDKINDENKFNGLKTFILLKLSFLTDFDIQIKDMDNKARRNIIYPKKKIVLTIL